MLRTRLPHLAGLIVGLVVAAALAWTSEVGRLIATLAFGLILLTGILLGERTTPLPLADGVRTASLVRRRVRDYVPPWPAAGVFGLLCALVVMLVATNEASTPGSRPINPDTMSSGPDDGRHISCVGADGLLQAGPWPGWYYGIPILATVAVAVVVALAVMRRIVTRPLVDTTTAAAEDYRRRSATTVTAATGLVVAVPLAGAAYASHSALGEALGCLDSLGTSAMGWLATAGVIAVTAIVYYAALLLFPTRPGKTTRRMTATTAG
ncbi:hypothetical protein BDK92_5435 [Micromonospora pisi]|uniref:Uncharacterized protein n=1 Tax=Micromonospora pisi TaxID=589240 RepID=A0A495JQD4_9ACTN|nr:hypothetical protein [Micromonospora pisi]RKR91051.1 hypothetical protein BDK92_5435 [Micromonospora pisi]